MERSVIRDRPTASRDCLCGTNPGLRCAPSGLRIRLKPQDRSSALQPSAT